jgi:hypothetical protein
LTKRKRKFEFTLILPLGKKKVLNFGLGRSKGRHFWKEIRRPEDLAGRAIFSAPILQRLLTNINPP